MSWVQNYDAWKTLLSPYITSSTERYEAVILLKGGCTIADAEWAISQLERSARFVRDDWGWLRATIINRAASRHELHDSIRAEVSSS